MLRRCVFKKKVHMSKKKSVQLHRSYVELREPHVGPTPGIDQQLHGSAIVAVIPEADQSACTGLPIKGCGTALRSGQGDEETRSSFRRRRDGRDPNAAHDRRRNKKSLHVYPLDQQSH